MKAFQLQPGRCPGAAKDRRFRLRELESHGES